MTTQMDTSQARPRRMLFGVGLLSVAILAVLLVALPKSQPGTTYVVTFPQGSTLQIDPAVFDAIPMRQVDATVWLEFAVGDTLKVTNDDAFSHVLWAIRVRPGETVTYTFTEPGTFTGECTFDLEVFLEVRAT